MCVVGRKMDFGSPHNTWRPFKDRKEKTFIWLTPLILLIGARKRKEDKVWIVHVSHGLSPLARAPLLHVRGVTCCCCWPLWFWPYTTRNERSGFVLLHRRQILKRTTCLVGDWKPQHIYLIVLIHFSDTYSCISISITK